MDKCFMVDVETAGSFDAPLVYDFGGQSIDMEGKNAGKQFNHVMLEVFYGMKEEMENAYFASKIPQYDDEIWAGDREVMDFMLTRKAVCDYLRDENITIICAHNARFDVKALNNTVRIITNGKVKYFFPYGVEVWDTLKMAHNVLKNDPEYRAYCEEHGYMTNHKTPRPRLTAEIIYRFITKNDDFEEAHTGLADVEIESEIFAYLVNRCPADCRVLYHAPARA